MKFRVIESFATAACRFLPGAEIAAEEIVGALSPEHWQRLGKIEPIPETADVKEDLPAGQARLKAAWDANRNNGVETSAGVWPIFVSDLSLYGEVSGDEEAPRIEVTIPGVEGSRIYPRAAVDFGNATVAGDPVEPVALQSEIVPAPISPRAGWVQPPAEPVQTGEHQ